MPITRRNTALVALVASVFVIAIGVQAYLADRDDENRDRGDAAFVACINDFVVDFRNAAEARSAGLVRLERANERKADALDRLMVIVALTREVPAQATEADFDAALLNRIKTQESYDRVAVEVARIRRNNDYPKVECRR